MPRSATPAEQAADRLHSAAIHLLRSLRREDARLGVGPAGLSVLSVLVFGGPKTIGALAAIEHVKAPTMSRIVSTLERWGMVERFAGVEDRRRIVVHPTSTGRIVMKRGRANRVVELTSRIERLGETEIALLARAAELIDRIARVSKAEAPA
jgi:DNA-binding MarR family transcriptional regulator